MVCPLQTTGEWVTVALADGHGAPCATGDTVMANRFFSLLPEMPRSLLCKTTRK